MKSKPAKITCFLMPGGELAYLKLPASEETAGKVTGNVILRELHPKYQGPDVILDFDEKDCLCGIAIVLEGAFVESSPFTGAEEGTPPRGFLFTTGSGGDVAYLQLPMPPESGRRAGKTIRMYDLIPGYKGAEVMLDFDRDDRLFGIEVLL